MTLRIDQTGRSISRRILDAHALDCSRTQASIAAEIGTTVSYVIHVYNVYDLRLGQKQVKGQQYRPTAGKVRTVEPFAPRREANHACRKLSYRNGSLIECGEPTDGKTYCKACAHHLITLTDRVPNWKQQAARAA